MLIHKPKLLIIIKRRGFTLIELMLVIVIIASIVLYAATSMRSKMEDSSIHNTTVEMENWLQALATYYLVNNEWPQSLTDLTKNNEYIKAEAECSSWTVATMSSNCQNKSQYRLSCASPPCNSANNYYSGIELTLPNNAVAKKIADISPSAIVSGNSVKAYIPIPSIASEQKMHSTLNWGYIESAGELQATHETCDISQKQLAKIDLPECGKDANGNPMEGHYIQFYLQQRTGRARPRSRLGSVNNTCVLWYTSKNTSAKCCLRDSNEHAFVTLAIDSSTGLTTDEPYLTAKLAEVGKGTIAEYNHQYNYYITFCIPAGKWYGGNTNPAPDTSPKGFPDNARQCALKWGSYNPTCYKQSSSPTF